MKARLQFAATILGPFKDCGSIRLNDKEYNVKAVTARNILRHPETTNYKVTVEANTLDVNPDLLTSTTHYFRLYFWETNQKIDLGTRPYVIKDFDGKPDLHNIFIYKIELEFSIKISEFNDYTIPLSAPITTEGIYTESGSDVYIE